MAKIDFPDIEHKIDAVKIPDGDPTNIYARAEDFNTIGNAFKIIKDYFNNFPDDETLKTVVEKISTLIRTDKDIQDLLRGPAGDMQGVDSDYIVKGDNGLYQVIDSNKTPYVNIHGNKTQETLNETMEELIPRDFKEVLSDVDVVKKDIVNISNKQQEILNLVGNKSDLPYPNDSVAVNVKKLSEILKGMWE